MTRLRFLTAGESHGPALVGILDGRSTSSATCRGASWDTAAAVA